MWWGEEGPRARSEQQQDGGSFGDRGRGELRELSKHGRNGAQLPRAHPRGTLVHWDRGRWARNWDVLPAVGICEENREL